ncbi:MAG: carbohydrate binding domain-containing protein [Phycisphaerae bacterium]
MTALLVAGCAVVAAPVAAAAAPQNLFANPDFEMGRQAWRICKTDGTTCTFSVDGADAAAGRHSALLAVERARDWGMQFGQYLTAGAKGRTYTFAVFARAVEGRVAVDLQVERSGKPYDRAARSRAVTLTDAWQELHVTFTVEKEFPEGWFAYVSCTQAGARFRVDMFRLYEGLYVPYEAAAREARAPAAVRLFDTAAPSPDPLPAGTLKARPGWVEVPRDNLGHLFKGDAVLLNNRIALVLRRRGNGAEVYAVGAAGLALRARLTPVGETTAGRLASLKVIENDPAGAILEATHTASAGRRLGVAYALRMGQVFVETTARQGTRSLRVAAPSRFIVLPDFFADDIVLDARALPVGQADLPADHVVLRLLPDRRAIVMTVVKTAAEDVRVGLAGQGEARCFDESEIPYGEDGNLWVAVLASPGIWHAHDVSKEDAGKAVRLDWTRPFLAQYRVDYRRENGLTDSWEMVVERPDGRFTKQGSYGGGTTLPPNRSRWTTVLGRFAYPCWMDRGGRGHLQPLKSKVVRFEGPAVVYPVNRSKATPLDAFTVVDIVRNALGVGPCEFILDVEGQRAENRGRATCSARDTLNPIFAKGRQREQRAKIERTLDEVMVFIRYIRGRIAHYRAFAHDLLDDLAAEKRAHPDLAEPLADLEALARTMDERFAARKDAIKTPAYAQKMCDEFRRTMIDYEGDDAAARCKRFTKALVEIGGNQDELAGECRWAMKMIRQQAGLMAVRDPRLARIAADIRDRTGEVMRRPAGHEGARH